MERSAREMDTRPTEQTFFEYLGVNAYIFKSQSYAARSQFKVSAFALKPSSDLTEFRNHRIHYAVYIIIKMGMISRSLTKNA